jgi:hypothetical protein
MTISSERWSSDMTTPNLMFAMIVGLLLSPLPTSAQPAEKPTRELVKNQEPIAQRVAPRDRYVTIRRPGFKEKPIEYQSAELESLTLARLEELFVLRQVTAEPSLADNGTWIRTRIRGKVAQVLNTDRLALFPGATVEFEVDGGEMIINGVRVIAGWSPDLGPHPHLIALQKDSMSNRWQLAKAFELNDRDVLGPITHRDRSEPAKSKLHGLTLDKVAAEIAKGRQK